MLFIFLYICNIDTIPGDMQNVTAADYGALRLKKDTLEFLKDMKEAFEASYEKHFTKDEFIRQMAASVEAGDPAVWEVFCTLQLQKDELREKVAATKKLRGGK